MKTNIKTWRAFARHVRSDKEIRFLSQLPNFPGSFLVGGCQRSGTTMISNILGQGDGITQLPGKDKELSAALVLSGIIPLVNESRYCFQTTYINDRYAEYWENGARYKMVWMLRNPESVVYSLTRFSERFCLNGLFMSCGRLYMTQRDEQIFKSFGPWFVREMNKACYCFNAKVCQLVSVIENMGNDNVLVVDYDELVVSKNAMLPKIFNFLEVDYSGKFSDMISDSSLIKSDCLSQKAKKNIQDLSGSYYNMAKSYLS